MPRKNIVTNRSVSMNLKIDELHEALKTVYEEEKPKFKNGDDFAKFVTQYIGFPYLFNVRHMKIHGMPLLSLGASGIFMGKIFYNPINRTGYIQNIRDYRKDTSMVVIENRLHFSELFTDYRALSPQEKSDFLNYAKTTYPDIPTMAVWVKEKYQLS